MGVIAKSEWRGGEQKKLEKLEFDMPTYSYSYRYSTTHLIHTALSYCDANVYER